MGSGFLNIFFGWSAFLSAAAAIGTAITGVLFFSRGGRFGKINDTVSVVQMLFMLPVTVGVYLLLRPLGAILALLITAAGVLGILAAGILQALLVLDALKFEQVFNAGLKAGIVIGGWLLAVNTVAIIGQVFPMGLTICGMAGGLGYILLGIGFHKGSYQHPLSYIGSSLTILGYLAWAVWLGRLFLAGGFVL